MGEEKAFLEVGGRLLIDHAMRRLKPFDCDIFIVGPKSVFNAFGRIVEDKFPGKGPLAGIQAALQRTHTEFNVITAVDTPLVPSSLLEKLLEEMRCGAPEVVVPKAAGGLHPLTGVYRQTFLPTAEKALKEERLKVDQVIAERTHTFFDAELNGFAPELFLNVNKPEDLEKARRWFADEQAKAANR